MAGVAGSGKTMGKQPHIGGVTPMTGKQPHIGGVTPMIGVLGTGTRLVFQALGKDNERAGGNRTFRGPGNCPAVQELPTRSKSQAWYTD
jgi:hypothetical protein